MKWVKLTFIMITGALILGHANVYESSEAEAATVKLPQVKAVDGDRVLTLLPPDGIPAIDKPEFATADKARFMKDSEPVVGVVHKGVAKAYSLWHLDTREIVNDRFGKEPVAVTW